MTKAGRLVVVPCISLLLGCGARDDFASGATIAVDTIALPTIDEVTDETEAPPTTSQLGSTVAPPASAEDELGDTVPSTTSVAADLVTSPPVTVPPPPEVSDASVEALAVVLGVEGELERHDGEHGAGQCIGRLEPRGLCVNVPLWGTWQYFDLSAQDAAGATNDQARLIAIDLFARLGVDPGSVVSIEPNGPLPQVKFTSGALVMVSDDGRIAMVIAGTSLLPVG